MTENKLLKEKLTELEELSNNCNSPLTDCDHLYKELQEALINEIETLDNHYNKENQNLITILQLFTNNCSTKDLKNKIKWLEDQKLLVESKVCEEDKDTINYLINKINNYKKFVETMSTNCESVFSEICFTINLLISNIIQLNQKLGFFQEKSQKSGILDNYTESKKCESYSLSDVMSQTDDILCNKSEDKYSQILDYVDEVDSCERQEKDQLLNQLWSNVNVLEQEKTQSEHEILNLKCLLNKTLLCASIQTDQYVCDCETLKTKLDNARKELTNYKQIYTSKEKEHLDNLNDFKEKLLSKESILAEKDALIQSQEKEIISLHDKLDNLTENFRSLKNFSSKEINSIEVPCDKISMCNDFEKNEIKLLQEKISSLELEKSKLICVLNEKSQECSSLKAEVHKLTNIVASEKQALLKLQQDNCELRQSNTDKLDPELTKETVKKLSNIIRDKDFEIESLKLKNSTLTTLIQDASAIPEHLQSLLEEKENLSKQIIVYKTDREKFMVKYNMKDKDCRKYMTEAKELNDLLVQKKEKFDVLEQTHLSLIQQYEEKQKTLINVQNEMITLKQRLVDLEQQLTDFKEKSSNQHGLIHITKNELNDKNTKIEHLTCANEEKDHLIQEKDCMIHDLSQQVKKMKLESEQKQQIFQSLEKKISESMNKIVDLKNSVEELDNDKKFLEQKLQDKESESNLLKDMNERLNMAVKEQEFSIQSMTEKLSSLSQYINSDHSSSSETTDINQILAESEAMFSKAQDLYRERDETLLALNQSKQENQNLRNEIQRMKSNEIHLKNDLDRLREHLLEIEENYTSDALKAEDREKRLQDELIEVKRRAEITSTAVVDTNQRASIQIASLQEQLSIIASQRDDALTQISSLEDQVLQHSTAAGKLQLVLEQMQKANERKMKELENKWQLLLEREKLSCKRIEEQLLIKQRQLEESSQALEAASRLSEQLDAKEEIIANLRSELSKTENKIKSTAQEIDTIKSNTEGKVDRVIMKSLVLGYFSTPPNQKSEVIRLLARVLDFNQEEMEKAGIVVGRQNKQQESKGILSSIFGRFPKMSSEHRPHEHEKSFTTLFVQFLENESQPVVPMPFPIEKMTQDVTHNKFGKKSLLTQNQSSPRKSPLLLDIDSAFPSFTPLPAIEFSPAPSILKEVLQ
ncbi:thyroid receptor-interacting protein 11 [Trichonephila clavata]|uniref:Thyroid receptor-interacting protein 11 n=1 Tax=Trichonephila clavata TaxID=2740835 RepID=A0A8X6M1N1_TRICU|nr:thyroid receptor-interacting protein 11 [Trichonephila clavata]